MIILKKQLHIPPEGSSIKTFSRYREFYRVNMDGHIFKVRLVANSIVASGNGVETLSADTMSDIKRLIKKANGARCSANVQRFAIKKPLIK